MVFSIIELEHITKLVSACGITDLRMSVDGFEIGEAGGINLIRGDRAQAAEVFMDALALPAGPAFEVFLEQCGSGLPWPEMCGESGPEIGDDRCGRGCSDMHRAAIWTDKKRCQRYELSELTEVEPAHHGENGGLGCFGDLLLSLPVDS